VRFTPAGIFSGPVKPRPDRFALPSLAGIHLNSVQWGNPDDPKLVLLHGGGANISWWEHLAPSLAEKFHVVALDFRGHGDSDFPEVLEPGAFNRDLEWLLEHVGTREAVLIGHSMGGHVALDHASRYPETLGVVAIEISRGGDRRERRRTRLALAARRTYRSREEALRRFRFLPPAPGADEVLRHGIAERSIREEPDGRFGFKFDPRWFGLPPGPPLEASSIACPVLLIRGEVSGLLTAAGAAGLVAELPSARSIEIAGAGHNVHLERPDAVLEAIHGFLATTI
jgi:pimeloyl-ACP methyl ester carboxylesterase